MRRRIPPLLQTSLWLAAVGAVAVLAWLLIRDTEWWKELGEDAAVELPSDLTEVLSTAVVTRATVSDDATLAGDLRYQDAVMFSHRIDPVETIVTSQIGSGRNVQTVASTILEPDNRTITALPTPGQVVAPGDVLYETDSTPVYAMVGDVAAWRTMEVGLIGPDIAQLQSNLLDGGWGSDDLVDDGTWSTATTDAVAQWQEDTGQIVTGFVELGDVWFIAGPIRITDVLGTEGLVVSDGDDVFEYTSDVRAIEATVEEVPEGLLAAEDLTARLPDGSVVPVELRSVRGTVDGFEILLDLDIPDGAVPAIDGFEVPVSWTVNELVDSLTVPPEALRRVDGGNYVVDVLDGDVIRTTVVEVLGSAGRVVAVDGVDELNRVLVP